MRFAVVQLAINLTSQINKLSEVHRIDSINWSVPL